MRGSRDNNNSYSRVANNNSNNNVQYGRGGLDVYNDQNTSYYNDDELLPPYAQTILGTTLTPILLSEDYYNHIELQNRLRIYSLCILSISIFFWCWAVLNTLHLRKNSEDGKSGLDLGVVSFLGSALSSLLLLRCALGGKCYDRKQTCGCFGKKKKVKGNNSDKIDDDDDDDTPSNSSPRDHSPPGTWLRWFAVLTQLSVAANYMLGVLFAMTAGSHIYVYFGSYCFLFSLLWLAIAYSCFVLVYVYRGALLRVYGHNFLEPRNRISLLRSILIFLTSSGVVESHQDTRGGRRNSNGYYEDEETGDDIDEELLALTSGRGYTD